MTGTGKPVTGHDPRWAASAAEKINELGAALAGLAGGIEHVGATAVRGIPTEPVIDLAVRLTATANVSTVITRLTAAGWTYAGDHGDVAGLVFTCPPGVHEPALRVYVIGSGQPLWDRVIGVRDTLRSDRDLAARYAHLQADPVTYAGAIEPFLAMIADRFAPATHTPVVRRVRALLLTQAGNILTVRRSKSSEPVHWVLPGGGIEPTDTSLEHAVIREVQEETGGTPDLHRIVHIAVVGGHAHAIFLARIHDWDENARTGPEFTNPDPARGGYHLEELSPAHPAFTDGRVWPNPTAAFLAGQVLAGTNLFTLPDLRDAGPIVWEAR